MNAWSAMRSALGRSRGASRRRVLGVAGAAVSVLAFAVGATWLGWSVWTGEPPFEPVIVLAGSVGLFLGWLRTRGSGATGSTAVDDVPPPPPTGGPVPLGPLTATAPGREGLIGIAATARALVADPEAAGHALPDVWAGGGVDRPDQLRAIRLVVASVPEVAARRFLDLLEGPREASWWSTCRLAAETLSPPLRPYTERRLAELLEDRATVDPDLGSLVVTALGRTGAYPRASTIRACAEHDEDSLSTLGPSAATALAEIALQAPAVPRADLVELVGTWLEQHPQHEHEIGQALTAARPQHETVLRALLASTHDPAVGLAAQAFAHVGAPRAAAWILDRADELGAERSSRLGLHDAAGTLTDAAAAGRLSTRWETRSRAHPDLDRGLAGCAHLLPDDAHRDAVVDALRSSPDILVRIGLVRGAGLRTAPDASSDRLVDAGRRDDDPHVRGHAALAGARRGLLTITDLQNAAGHAARDDERILALLGLLTVSADHDGVVPEISTLLAGYRMLYAHGPRFDRDVQAALRGSASAPASALADDRDWLAGAR